MGCLIDDKHVYFLIHRAERRSVFHCPVLCIIVAPTLNGTILVLNHLKDIEHIHGLIHSTELNVHLQSVGHHGVTT